MDEVPSKKCNACRQLLPVQFFQPDIKMLSGYRNTCDECASQQKRKLKPDEIIRDLRRHNKNVITMAFSKMKFQSTAYNISRKQDVKWSLQLSKYDIVFQVGDFSIEYSRNMSLGQKIDEIANLTEAMSIRLELSPFDREMSKRTIYLY